MVPPPPIEWFENLAEFMGEAFKVRVASLNGQPIASIVTLHHGDTMVYKYGCSDPTYSHRGGVALLLWTSILEAKQLGLRELDFGRTDLDHSGLIRFKDRWGAAQTPLKYWRVPPSPRYAGEPMRKSIATVGRAVLARGPVSLFKIAGRFLYRHMG
jgi:hypothetical protein